MAKRKGLLTRSGLTDRQEPESNLRWEPNFEYLAVTRERVGQWIMGQEAHTYPRRHRF